MVPDDLAQVTRAPGLTNPRLETALKTSPCQRAGGSRHIDFAQIMPWQASNLRRNCRDECQAPAEVCSLRRHLIRGCMVAGCLSGGAFRDPKESASASLQYTNFTWKATDHLNIYHWPRGAPHGLCGIPRIHARNSLAKGRTGPIRAPKKRRDRPH